MDTTTRTVRDFTVARPRVALVSRFVCHFLHGKRVFGNFGSRSSSSPSSQLWNTWWASGGNGGFLNIIVYLTATNGINSSSLSCVPQIYIFMFIIIVFATRHRPHSSQTDYPFPNLDIRIQYMSCYVSILLGDRGGGLSSPNSMTSKVTCMRIRWVIITTSNLSAQWCSAYILLIFPNIQFIFFYIEFPWNRFYLFLDSNNLKK